MRVRMGGHVPRGICGKRDYHMGNRSIQILLNPYKLMHNSERVPCTMVVMCVVLRLAIFGKNSFLLFTAYSASVERWLVRDLVSTLTSLNISSHYTSL